jgi:two-component system chemotaxis response regulator CheY
MRILIVDDSKAMRMIVARTLRQSGFGGATIEEAGTGAEALRLITASEPDLVLCDWNMPEMNGLELLKTLRSQGSKVKFGFVTSEASAEMKETALAHGAQFLITKPFTPQAFEQTLKPLL